MAISAGVAAAVLKGYPAAKLVEMAEKGVEAACRADPGLAKGVYMYKGRMVNEQAAAALDLPHTPLEELLG